MEKTAKKIRQRVKNIIDTEQIRFQREKKEKTLRYKKVETNEKKKRKYEQDLVKQICILSFCSEEQNCEENSTEKLFLLSTQKWKAVINA